MADRSPTTAELLLGDWLAVAPGCPMCEVISTAFAAIDIVTEGDQISESCHGCGRCVRPFSWHRRDGLPTSYLIRFDHRAQATEATAWYCPAGVVRSVPAVDPCWPSRYHWPNSLDTSDLARAILAHLVGLDVPAPVWEAFDFDIVLPLALAAGTDVYLATETIAEWLEANR